MKNMKKLFSLLMVVIMALTFALPVMAQTVDSGKSGSASITISNAAKGVEYTVVKLFDASVGANDAIVYTGDIPTALKDYFKENDAGNIVIAEDKTSKDVTDAVTAWAKDQTSYTATAISDGSVLKFTNLPYGYYVVTTNPGAAVTITSTNPTAEIFDKNPTDFSVAKKVDDDNVYIGQTVEYTVTATTANFLGEGKDAQQVVQYEIADTLPAFLTDVNVTSIIIDEDGNDKTAEGQIPLNTQQFNNKKITIDWVDENGDSLYTKGSLIIITYEATVTSPITIDGAGNKNEVTLTPYVADSDDDGNDPDPWDDSKKAEAIIYTYAAALQKVDENKKPLAGATFKIAGLTATGGNGVYTVTGYDGTENDGTEMVCDSEGQLVILGLSTDDTWNIVETEAPAGYNKLVGTTTMTPVKTGEEITATEKTIYYDANGKVTNEVTETSYNKTTYNVNLLKTAVVVVNEKGNELPSTGGMGTTIFYVVGGVLVVAAGVLLITKKRMKADK